LVAHGKLVEPGSHGAVAFEPVDAAFHGVALLVDLGVEGGAPPTGGAFRAPVGVLVALAGNGCLDPVASQVGAGGVCLVGQHPIGPGAGATTTDAGHPDTGQYRRELRAVTPLPGGDHDRQRLLTLLTGQMHLRGQPAP
jgi:hypothetical protein